MRSRTVREGSVGLIVLLGLGVFGLIVVWLNRVTASRGSYKATVEFANAGGMQKGATVRYRGVKVGAISAIRPMANNIEVEIEIFQPNLIIPKEVVIEANQSGLISESIIDITPKASLPKDAVLAQPLDRKNCEAQNLIICDGARLKGQIGISLDELIRSSTNLASRYDDPEFKRDIKRLLETSTAAATSFTVLSRDLQNLSKSAQGQLGSFSATANSVQQATNQLTVTSTRTANELGSAAKQFSLTASQASRLLTNLDNLVTTNRSSLVAALNNLTETSNQLRTTFTTLSPAVDRLAQGEIIKNLETLSANAAQASANLRNATNSLNDPKNALLLQQTLDSARLTFENTQKITSDLDELTGDPKFRSNLRQLVNGLSSLVSSTEQMEQTAQVAVTLDSLKASINQPNAKLLTPTIKPQAVTINPVPTSVKIVDKHLQPPASLSSSQPTTEELLQKLREYSKQREQENLSKVD
ncbi:MCE family protein [Tolypothrix sp. FACHB-123]|uniref:MlaD family protein n=1 Tax=Tolypothrix sp. FACHB-123 TaxID=2692868 RepID=UPI001681F2FF|nr:MlaD family protein [Tolypothrix sp. FACHB-123]MBD2355287.1 MCE family protein [Tolypothrix sp. FACHB-123]